MKKAVITLMACLLIVGASATILMRVNAIHKAMPEEEVPTDDKLPNVAVEVLRPGLVEDKVFLTGTATPWESVTISAETAGKLEWQGVDDGEAVSAKQEIVRVDTTSARARMDLAVAEFDLAKQEFERVEKLREGGISSPQEYDRAVTNREATQANVRLAKIELDKSVITAQIPGVADVVYNEEGEFVTVGTPLLRIVQVDKLKVLIGLPERDVIYSKPGQTVMMQFDAFPGEFVSGTVHRIATTAEASTRTFRVEIEVDNREGKYKPGMMTRVQFVRKMYADALTVPLFAVLNRDEQQFVFVEKDETAHLREIQTGFYQGGRILVSSGVDAGERLIVTGQRDIRDGQAIRVGDVQN